MQSILTFCLTLLSALLLLSSCNDDEDDLSTIERVDAQLVWSDPAVDGCGFLLHVGQQEYKPVNESAIDDSYKDQPLTAVEATFINYHKPVKAPCGWNQEREVAGIKLISLHRK
ncbi:hypothetical protein [Pontibacter liquoris]|uniref:hypothetical protein n=1 Tax=Pontibacter liquoris TaxID=2905677 RepID=UPI001FA76EDA|nr:hypothetical protein [Pontibacter liquoris]